MNNVKSKKALFILILMTILFSIVSCPHTSACAHAESIDDSLRLNDIIITLSMPAITAAVNSFYEPYLAYPPTVVPYYGSNIISIEGGNSIHQRSGNSNYKITIDVFPYVGPHLSVSNDRITLFVKPDGITLENYEHLESYELPPNYQSYIKQPLP